MKRSAVLGFIVFLFSFNLWAFCLQTFNAYGPAYATRTSQRTAAFSEELSKEPRCSLVNLQEVWSESQTQIIQEKLNSLYKLLTPNRLNKIGLMSLIDGHSIEEKTYLFKINNEDGILDSIRELFGVHKAFDTSLISISHFPENIYLINTHLHPSSQAVRLAQIMDIFEWRMNHTEYKMILSGDFNSEPNSLERALLMLLLGAHDSMGEVLGTYPKDFCTYCGSNPRSWLSGNHVFDYVFFSNISNSQLDLNANDGLVDLKGNADDVYSDHYGLKIEYSWGPQADIIAANQLEARTQYLIKVLEATELVLSKKSSDKFQPYLKRLKRLRQELDSQQGLFWSYFSNYR